MDPNTISHGASDGAHALFAIHTLNFDATTSKQPENLTILLAILLKLKLSTLFILLRLSLFSVLSSFTSGSWHLSSIYKYDFVLCLSDGAV